MQGGSRSNRARMILRDRGARRPQAERARFVALLSTATAALALLSGLASLAAAQGPWQEPSERSSIRTGTSPAADNTSSVSAGSARIGSSPSIELPEQAVERPVLVSARTAERWREGVYDVWHLIGGVSIRQGEVDATGSEAIVWVDQGDPYLQQPTKVLVYLEGAVEVRFGPDDPDARTTRNRYRSTDWFGRFQSLHSVEMSVVPTAPVDVAAIPMLDRARRAMTARFDDQVAPVQFPQTLPGTLPTEPPVLPPGGAMPSSPGAGLGAPAAPMVAPNDPANVQASVRFGGRNGGRPNISSRSSADGTENVWVFDEGIRITVESPSFSQLQGGLADVEQVVLMADRGVAWTRPLAELIESPSGSLGGQRWEFYLEGNIVFAAGERVIYADYLYYDANFRRGTILNAEVLSPVDGFDGLLRMKAEILQQLDQRTFRAYDAAVTSSRLGYPTYWVQTGDVQVTHDQIPRLDPFTGTRAYDPATGMPLTRHQYLTESRNNFVYVGGVPIFYWPVLTNDLADPTYYLEQISVKNDSVFGTQVLTDWDLYQLLGIRDRPEGTDWNFTADWMSQRGFGLGTEFTWDRRDLFGIPGPYAGRIDAWGIDDNGTDNLGQDRRTVPLEEEFRYRVLGQHRQRFDSGWQLTAEAGLISDRNFLEQYYEREWDRNKDQSTGIELLRNTANRQFSVNADYRLNDFFAQTEWLPRLDYSVIGQPILGDALVWTGRTSAGYARLKPAEAPTNPVDLGKFDPLAWENDVEGARIGTRQQIEFPFQAGPVRLAFYGLGDATYYGNDLTGDDLTRLYGQLGLRTSLPFWKVDPTVRSELFNVDGLAHKISLDSDLHWADASADLADMPLYDNLDDDSQEAFRRRFFFDTFGGLPGGDVPLRFDERNYAFRSNTQGNVTSPTWDLADDLLAWRFSLDQRWQTKRGRPGDQRIIDWITFDVGATWFPEATRDNFGESIGLLDARFRWHVGDRLTLLSDASADLFADGLRTVSVGMLTGRPETGNLYIGFRSIEGPLTANILSGSFSYRMSEKWLASAGGSVDFGPTGNIGQTISFTRVGESFLLRFGLRADASRGNVGAIFAIEPRFLARASRGQIEGIEIPPPGSRGLE